MLSPETDGGAPPSLLGELLALPPSLGELAESPGADTWWDPGDRCWAPGGGGGGGPYPG